MDVGGKVIFPGVIDPHVHLGVGDGAGPSKMRSDFESESRDAAAGGVTTMVTTTLLGSESRGEVTEFAIKAGNELSIVDFRLTAVVTQRQHLEEINALAKLGVRTFKFFLGYRGAQAEGFGMAAEGVPWDFFYSACETIGAAGARAFPTIHAEDPFVRDFLHERLKGTAKNNLLQAWLETSPNILEPMQIYPAALIAHEVGTPVYIVHTSAAESVELIRDLQHKGWDIRGETLAAFLYWTAAEADAKELGAYAKIQPPIRRSADREALWTGIRDSTIGTIGTDCQMYSRESRHVDFWDARVGLGPGMGTLLPAVYTAGVLRGRCSIEDLARVLAENTAREFDLYPQKGCIAVGSDADLVVLDTDTPRSVRAADLQTAAGYSVYEGEELRGWPTAVYVRGKLVARDGRVTAEAPCGRHVP
jgi:dihydroorotase-like cyclic amidohydrolase